MKGEMSADIKLKIRQPLRHSISRPIKVCHVITSLTTGGAQKMLVKLLSQLDRKNFDSHVIALVDGVVKEEIQELDIPVTTLGNSKGLPSLLNILRLASCLKMQSPDLVQGWMYHANLAAQIAIKSLPRKIPIFWNIRHTLYGLHYEKITTRYVVRLGKALSTLPSVILYNSHTSASQHASVGYCDDFSFIIPNGFDCRRFSPKLGAREKTRKKLGFSMDTPVVGNIARFHPMKDHANLLRAASLLLRSMPEVHFVLIGPGIDEGNDYLRGFSESLGIRSKIHFLGERFDVEDLIPAFDIACLSSAWGEAFPNFLGEAMACGVPCVATNVGDSKWIVGDNNFVVPPSNPEALASACQTLLQLDPIQLRVFGERARTRIIQEFSIENIAHQYASLYELAVKQA